MTFRAIAARDLGGDYQARWFWLQACRLFDRGGIVRRVGYEVAFARAFDDVVTFYEPTRPVYDAFDQPVHLDCFQAKYHVDLDGEFTYQNLTQPPFVGANSVSFLQRLHAARVLFERDGRRGRFTILSPWGIKNDDPFRSLVSNFTGELRLNLLADGGPNSEMGRVRACWREHLNLDADAALFEVLRPLRVVPHFTNIAFIREWLNARLQVAGLVPIEEDRIGYVYDDLARKLIQHDHREFDADAVRELAVREQLWVGRDPDVNPDRRLGIRSFMHLAENMEDETDAMVSLTSAFDGRYVRDQRLWRSEIYPKIAAFLTREVVPAGRYRLMLDCHMSIAFAAGYAVGPKASADFTLVQKARTQRLVWHPDDSTPPPESALWATQIVGESSLGRDIAIGISITHSVRDDVEKFVRENLPSVGRILLLTVKPGPGPTAVRDGTHALQLTRSFVDEVRGTRTMDEREGIVHIFGAMPNTVAFLLGREARVLGRCSVYEHDLDTMKPGGYMPALSFPPPAG